MTTLRRGVRDKAPFSKRTWAGFGLGAREHIDAPWRVTVTRTAVAVEMWDERHGDYFDMVHAARRLGGLGAKKLRLSGFPVRGPVPADLLERFVALADRCTAATVRQFVLEHGPLGVRLSDAGLSSAGGSLSPRIGREPLADWERLSIAMRNALEINAKLAARRPVSSRLVSPIASLIGGVWTTRVDGHLAEIVLMEFVKDWFEAAQTRLMLSYLPGNSRLVYATARWSPMLLILGLQFAQRISGARQTLICTVCTGPFLRIRKARIPGPAVCPDCRRRNSNRELQARRRARLKAQTGA